MARHYVCLSKESYQKIQSKTKAPKFLRFLAATYEPERLVDDPDFDSHDCRYVSFDVDAELDQKVSKLMKKHGMKCFSTFYRRFVFTYFWEQQKGS